MIVSARCSFRLEPRVLGFELLDAWIDEALLRPPPTRQEQVDATRSASRDFLEQAL